ncbi:hypothetical protein [Modestobacter versicolor]|uniref:hypothetical protein n=1 Tax=Modestobacter versicolor TaxID=429133 RepID=UPI0034DF49A2
MSAPDRPADWDLLVAVMGAPYDSDATSTVLRWVDAATRRDARVQVWTCGYATLLTQRSTGPVKEPNPLDRTREHATARGRIEQLLAERPTLQWSSCRFCSTERGALDHIDAVRLRPALSFGSHVRESAKTVFVGLT